MNSPVIVITGASKGIGRSATIQAIVEHNARVIAVARSSTLLDELKQHLTTQYNRGQQLEVIAGDITDKDILRKIVNTAISKWGQLDSVIANAGVIDPILPVVEGDIEDWKRLFDVNVFSIVSLIQQAIIHLRQSKKASIIIVSSGAAVRSYKGWGAYGSSKAAITHIAGTLAVEETEVTTIAIRPGVVDTDMQTNIRSTGAFGMKDDHTKFTNLHQQGQLVKPEQPARVLVSLAVNPPKELSGGLYNWNDVKISDYCGQQ
ncbi:hypothetical protein BDB01DRAFT_813431 [Pilobolus umbonatus]|nr:hypothetical protein BDB01DRAFT_813431 [Pilobolus umbonatus]